MKRLEDLMAAYVATTDPLKKASLAEEIRVGSPWYLEEYGTWKVEYSVWIEHESGGHGSIRTTFSGAFSEVLVSSIKLLDSMRINDAWYDPEFIMEGTEISYFPSREIIEKALNGIHISREDLIRPTASRWK